MKKFLMGIAATLLLLISVLLVRTLSFTPPTLPQKVASADPVPRNGEAMAKRLAQAIQFPTVSAQLDQPDTRKAFRGFIDWLAATYP